MHVTTDLTGAHIAAGQARHRLDEMGAELDAALRLLDGAAHATDWRSPAADSFHSDIAALRTDIVRLRGRVEELATTAVGVGVLLADLAERPR